MSLPAIPPAVYMDLLGISEDELSVPPAKVVEESRPSRADATFEDRLSALDLNAAVADDTARRAAFGTPEPKRPWSEPEELVALRIPDNRIERLELEVGLFGGLKTLDVGCLRGRMEWDYAHTSSAITGSRCCRTRLLISSALHGLISRA
jgi:hypothetical protein